jgi:DNA replication and repair protein RecF
MAGAALRVLGAELRDFRTYTRASVRLGAGLTVVHGANGAGKSNLLEAVYFGCTGRSPRTRSERELVRFGARATRVEVAVTEDGRDHELSVGYAAAAPGEQAVKRMTCDGAVVERLLDVPVRPLISVFMPERLELVKGPPAVRRAHVDQLVAALWPARAATRREYSHVLAQRNALLARIRAGRSSHSALETWDRELAAKALPLRADRQEAVAMLHGPFADRAEQLGCNGTVTLEYKPRSSAVDEQAFVAELAARLPGDLERGFTGHGPHRDELALLRDGRELRAYGSQGEQRLALLALLLAERMLLAGERGMTPLMLLDDVMSELDEQRRELLAAELAGGGQSVIATTELDHVPGAGEAAVTRIAVSPGALLQGAIAA